tara:strand:- start:372 stop:1373 length:1002 start_codon:yes stop_codon:yes gene_type:complete
MQFNFSFIIPVYNRPQEIKELLESFTQLEYHNDYEIVIIEDGSNLSSKEICRTFSSQLNISYYFKKNTGPGASRNYGMLKAKGNYFIILDSDCILPAHYLTTVISFLEKKYYASFGGADIAHSSFSALQKSINYVMTSFLTTGGIRGSEKSIANFEPRSFNMGISQDAFIATRGFAKIHPGEDPDLSIRLLKLGFKTTFISNAFVYHKRRTSWSKFYLQVKKFGMVRPILNSWHPSTSKITYWFPTFFIVFTIISILLSGFFNLLFAMPLILYLSLIFTDSSVKNKNIYIGLLSVFALFIQFFGYGSAFFKSTVYIRILKRDPEKQFPQLFFK